MKLLTFGSDNNPYIIVQFTIFVQPYSQSPLTVYEMEIVPGSIIYQNIH